MYGLNLQYMIRKNKRRIRTAFIDEAVRILLLVVFC